MLSTTTRTETRVDHVPERRLRRSDDAVTALHHQLASARMQARLQAVVLVDPSGCLVAGAGAWPICEELAAYAPLLRRPTDVVSREVGGRVAALARETASVAFRVDGVEVLLCGRGDRAHEGGEHALRLAAEGCGRILAGCPTSRAASVPEPLAG